MWLPLRTVSRRSANHKAHNTHTHTLYSPLRNVSMLQDGRNRSSPSRQRVERRHACVRLAVTLTRPFLQQHSYKTAFGNSSLSTNWRMASGFCRGLVVVAVACFFFFVPLLLLLYSFICSPLLLFQPVHCSPPPFALPRPSGEGRARNGFFFRPPLRSTALPYLFIRFLGS